MNDKQFDLFVIFAAIALFVWWLWEKHNSIPATQLPPSEGGPVQSLDWPMSGVSPEAYTPPTIGKLSLNVQNPGFNMLSNQYIPMFGFVGMAQGEGFA